MSQTRALSASQAHSDLVNRLLIALSQRGHMVTKFTTGTGFTQYGARISFGCPGWADIIGTTDKGQFIAVEAKTGTGRLQPNQKAFREQVEKRGGIFITARSETDLDQLDLLKS
jgi:hypothetical protein